VQDLFWWKKAFYIFVWVCRKHKIRALIMYSIVDMQEDIDEPLVRYSWVLNLSVSVLNLNENERNTTRITNTLWGCQTLINSSRNRLGCHIYNCRLLSISLLLVQKLQGYWVHFVIAQHQNYFVAQCWILRSNLLSLQYCIDKIFVHNLWEEKVFAVDVLSSSDTFVLKSL